MYDSIYMTFIQEGVKLVGGDLWVREWESVVWAGREYRTGSGKFLCLGMDGYMGAYM